MFKPELWRIITTSPQYEVSNYGDVRTTSAERQLKPDIINGNLWVWIRQPYKTTHGWVRVDGLVADAFLPKPNNVDLEKIVHIDGDPFNCDVDNLVWH